MRKVVIAGSTGSIGTQAIEVVEGSSELEVVALSAGSNHELLLEQTRALGVGRIALSDEAAAARAAEAWTDGEVLAGSEGLVELIVESGADLVLNALTGSAGLGPTVATLGEGIDLALANKESLVVGGELVMALAEATGAQVIPVDSEHSALHQLVAGEAPGTVDRLVLTASGGPFRGRSADELEDVTVEQALAHPTWDMGGRITIDSATLFNKGLEVIEAHHLFGTPYDQIDVVVHPQSIVHGHGPAERRRVPCPSRPPRHARADLLRPAPPRAGRRPGPTLDLAAVGSLQFEAPDEAAFPCLRLAREAADGGRHRALRPQRGRRGGRARLPQRRPPFTGIPRVIEDTLEAVPAQPLRDFSNLTRPTPRRAATPPEPRYDAPPYLVLAAAGFMALVVILHEMGHFFAAKAVGMRVENFSLFFPPNLSRASAARPSTPSARSPSGAT